MLKTMSLVASGVLLSTSLLAATPLQSATIPLTGGTASPGNPLHISIKPLPAEVPYNINCTIVNPNSESLIANFNGEDGAGDSAYFLVDGQTIKSNAEIPAAKSVSLVVKDVSIPHGFVTPELRITDLDTTSSFTVTNCVANPVIGK